MSFRDLPAASLQIDGRMTFLRVYDASRFLARARGLLGRDRLHPHEALWIRPCGSVHTVGMRYALDLVFVDAEQRVLAIKQHVEPRRFVGHVRARSTIELLAGIAAQLSIAPGAKLERVVLS